MSGSVIGRGQLGGGVRGAGGCEDRSPVPWSFVDSRTHVEISVRGTSKKHRVGWISCMVHNDHANNNTRFAAWDYAKFRRIMRAQYN